MARQFYADLFINLEKATGAQLENIVYVKADASHYMVMTPTPKCLVQTGVVKDASCWPMVTQENVDMAKLKEFCQKVAAYQLKKAEPAVIQAILSDLGQKDCHARFADTGPRLFDFSSTSRASEGLVFANPPQGGVDGQGPSGSNDDDSLLIALVGDALVEPFWPEGLGLIRGFFGGLDASASVARWNAGASQGETQAYHANAYKLLKSLGAATRQQLLFDKESSYTFAPNSRYRQFG